LESSTIYYNIQSCRNLHFVAHNSAIPLRWSGELGHRYHPFTKSTIRDELKKADSSYFIIHHFKDRKKTKYGLCVAKRESESVLDPFSGTLK
jgi:hypothetical protein